MKQKLLPDVKYRLKSFFDELLSDERIEDPLKAFRIRVFNKSLDILNEQITTRFISMNNVNELFSFLAPAAIAELRNEKLQEKATKLVEKYDLDLSFVLIEQLITFKALMTTEVKMKNMVTIKDLANFLFVENNCLASSLPDLCTEVQLYLTLPVTYATAERSFSNLKLVKTFLRNNMTQTRLSALALISIENETCRTLDLEEVVNKFMVMSQRRFGKL